MRFARRYLVMAGGLAALDFTLLGARFIVPAVEPLFTLSFRVLNVPCGWGLLWLERRDNVWWFGMTEHRLQWLLNDEIGTGLALIIVILLQALLVTLLFHCVRRKGAQGT